MLLVTAKKNKKILCQKQYSKDKDGIEDIDGQDERYCRLNKGMKAQTCGNLQVYFTAERQLTAACDKDYLKASLP